MKELSIEEKAKRYDEAKARMSRAYNDNRCSIGFMNEIFPELKESEDEKIKKRIIQALHGDVLDMEETTKAITWLEKQGEVVVDKELSDLLNKVICNFINDITIPYSERDEVSKKIIPYVKQLEKQGEQKHAEVRTTGYWNVQDIEQNPTDKVEPKFKVGDWILIDKPCQIISINDNGNYIVRYCDTEETHLLSMNFCDSHFHLWTIQDAKDGDVLYSGQIILLFKKWEDTDLNFVIAYAEIDISGKLQITNGHWLISNYTHPATKEQRDTLMKAMTDAGYTFDFENKELKKIEQKPA